MQKSIFKLTLTFLLVPLLSCLINKDAAQKNFRAQVGLELYSLRREFAVNIDSALAIARNFGFKNVEIAGIPNLEPLSFKKKLDFYGLKAEGLMVSMKELKENPETVANNAKTLGCKFVIVAWIDHKDALLTFDEVKNAVEVFNQGGKILHEKGLQFCYHIHGYEFAKYQNGTYFDYIYSNTDPDFVKFEEDIFWAKHGGIDPVAFLQKYGNRTVLIHIKDMEKGIKGNNTGKEKVEADVAWGTGQVDIKSFIKAAKKRGIKYFYLEDESPEVLKQIPQSLKYAEGL